MFGVLALTVDLLSATSSCFCTCSIAARKPSWAPLIFPLCGAAGIGCLQRGNSVVGCQRHSTSSHEILLVGLPVGFDAHSGQPLSRTLTWEYSIAQEVYIVIYITEAYQARRAFQSFTNLTRPSSRRDPSTREISYSVKSFKGVS